MAVSHSGPKISVILSFADSAKYLASAIESVLSQTYADFELILIADGPQDGSDSIADSYSDSRIRHIRHSRIGLTASLNRGLDLASGELVARQDADDISLPDRFHLQVTYMDQNPQVALIGGGITLINSVGRSLGTYSYGTDDEDLRASLLRRLNPIPHTTMMFRRAEIAELGNYNPAFLRAQDVDLIHRVSEHHRIGAIGQPLCLLRFSDEGISIAPESGLEQRMYALLADAVAAYRRGTGVDVTRMPCWLEVSRAFASRFYRSGWPRRHGAWISLRHARAAFRARRPIRGLQHLLRSLWISPVAIGDRISRRDPRPDHLFWMEEAIGSLDQCEGGEAGGAS